MNELEREELEAENDGYRNDYQRALAASRAERKPDDRGKASRLVAQGFSVLLARDPVYCRTTDAYSHEHVTVLCHHKDRRGCYEALKNLTMENRDEDTRYEILPLLPEARVAVPSTPDDCPF